MSAPEIKTATIEVDIPAIGFPKFLYFNVLRVEKEPGFRFLQVGLLTSIGVVDSYECAITDFALEQNKETLIDYLAKLGPAEGQLPSIWRGSPVEKKVDVVDILHMSQSAGQSSEIILFAFSLTAAHRVTREQKGGNMAVPAQGLALLRCTVELQKHFITSLYE
jgi:hypothetical protein